MAAPGSTTTVTWAERMELLKDSAQQRVLNAPMPPAAMEQLIAVRKADALGRFEGSPVRYRVYSQCTGLQPGGEANL